MSTNGPALMLTDTIRRVAITENVLSQLGSDLAEIGAAQKDVHGSVEALRRQLSTLQDTVDIQARDSEDDETAVVDWSRLTRRQAEKEWSRLYDWIDTWLSPTYEIGLRQLLPCWPHHAAVREELSWLRTTWMQTYRRPGASGSAAGEWHTRWLPAMLTNIKRHFERRSCTLGGHDGHLLSDDLRAVESSTPSTRQYWLDAGREADIAARKA